MSACLPRERAAVHSAARAVADELAVLAAEPVRPRTSPTGRFALEVLTEPHTGGCPPWLARLLAEHGLSARRVHRGGDCWRVLATA